MTITDYTLSKRMELANKLLITTNFPINEISDKCGYTNHSRFSSTFKKKYKFTPSDFRQINSR